MLREKLCDAILRDDKDYALALTLHGADVNGRTNDGSTLLHLAVREAGRSGGDRDPESRARMVRLLCELGADTNARDSCGNTPLFHAARDARAQVVHYLIRGGADVNAVNPKGITALCLAAANVRGLRTVKCLVERGADVNKREGGAPTPILFAVGRGLVEAVAFLVENGADVRLTLRDGSTLLNGARGHKRITAYLSSLERARWGPTTHGVYPKDVRARIRAVLILRRRECSPLRALSMEMIFSVLRALTSEICRYVQRQ